MNKYLILLFCGLLLCSCSEPSPEELLIESEKLESQGKYKEAITVLNKAINLNPKFIKAYIYRGNLYWHLNKYDEAIQNYEQVLQIERFNRWALFSIGNINKLQDKKRKAVERYNELLLDVHGNPMAELVISDANGNIGQFDVRFRDVYYERGLALYDLNSLDTAFYDFSQCIKENYMVKESHYMLGAIYERYGMNKEACEQYSISKNLGDPDATDAMKQVCKN
jgi:tetratricopeptide (TPR) repeat protein